MVVARLVERWSLRRTALATLGVALVLGAAAVLWQGEAHATSITVNTELDPLPNSAGKYPNDGKCSLRAAIAAAQANSNAHDVDCATGLGGGVLDIISIDASLAGKTLTMAARPFDTIWDPANPLQIVGPTTSSSGFTVNGNSATRIFQVGLVGQGHTNHRGELKLANLTIRGGNGRNANGYGAPDGDGGAMYLGDGTHLILDNVVLRDNTVAASARGAAIYGIRPTITNNGGAYINNNAAGNGGTGAGGGRGGAIFMEQGPSTLNGYAVLFDGNKAAYAGGAIATNPGSSTAFVHLERSLTKNNSATVGGVAYVDSSAPGLIFELADSTATGNSSTQGGGVFFAQATTQRFRFLRNTFVNNTGPGGLFSAGGGDLVNSILVNSGCQNTTNGGFLSIRNLTGGTNEGCAFMGSIGTITGMSATLAQNGGPLVQQTFALSPTSNAIDNGDAGECGAVDARSVRRGLNATGTVNSPVAGDCDIGAYEYTPYIVNFVTGTSSVLEGQNATIQVKLSIPDASLRPLTAPLTVEVARNAGSNARSQIDYSLPSTTVTFPAGATHLSVANLTFNTINDRVAERNGEFVLLDIVSAGGAIAEPMQHQVTIQDDDQAGFVKNDGGNGTTVSEATTGTTDSFSIALRSQPDYNQPDPFDSNSRGPAADVSVRLEPDRDCAVTVNGNTGRLGSPVSFTIANANWQTAHNLAVAAADDPYDEDLRDETAPHNCTITMTFTSGDPVYNATTDAYDVRIVDNDVAGVTVVQSNGTTGIAEGGATDTYTVVLNTPPDPGKPLPSPARGPTYVFPAIPAGQCDAGSGPVLSKNLPFTSTNWNVPQTITVKATDDPTVELNHSCVITTNVQSQDPVYDTLDELPAFAQTPAAVTAAVADNDPPNVTITSTGGTSVSEATPGTGDGLTVVLARQPLGQDVLVALSSPTDPVTSGPQLLFQDNNPATPDAPSSSLTITFKNTTWNTAQAVSVFAADDEHEEADPHSVTISATMTSTAVGFADASMRKFVVDGTESLNTASLPVTIADNDKPSIVVTESGGSTAVVEGGATDTYTFRLGTRPSEAVDVTVAPGPQCDVGSGPGVARSYLVAAAAWKTPVTVTVSAPDDLLIEAPKSCAIAHSSTSAGDSRYNLTGPSVTATVGDNEARPGLVAWGYNAHGQTNVPAGLTGIRALAAGSYHNLILKTDGTVVAWGRNTNGQSTVPAGLSGVVAVDGGWAHSLALKTDGTVVAWGSNNHGQTTVPAGLTGVAAISAGGDHSLALKNDGTVVAWGDNAAGQSTVPAGLTGVTALDAGAFHSVALKADGTVVAWGANDSGQATVPAGLSGVSSVSADWAHTLALKADGTVVAWGNNDHGQRNVPAGLTGVIAVNPGHWHSLALKADGTVVAWGLNTSGQTVIPAGLTGVGSVDAGGDHNLALVPSVLAANDSYSTAEDVALTVDAPGVLTNDIRTDGVTLSVSTVAQPAHGTVTLNADGSFTYTPAPGYSGSDGFTYKLNDGTVASNVATVSITVTAGPNQAPVALDDAVTTTRDTPLTGEAPGVLGNDTDADNDTLTAIKVTDPAHGTVALNADGSFTYTPAADYHGPDSFTYKATDGTADSNVATVSITVTPPAADPTTVADFDGDGKTDISVFDPAVGDWRIEGEATVTWGTEGDIAVPGDYDGDGDTDLAVYRPSTGVWFVQDGPAVAWGTEGDIPVPGDYDGDGDTDFAVYRPSTGVWFVQDGPMLAWGTEGDIPVPGDYDGDGDTDIGVYRPSLGVWFVEGGETVTWGTEGEVPLPLPHAIARL